MLQCNLGMDAQQAADIFRWFPIGAAFLTPFLGYFLDRFGKGASMLLIGALLMIACHLTFALVIPVYPTTWLAFTAIIVLGISFSLVPQPFGLRFPKLWMRASLDRHIHSFSGYRTSVLPCSPSS